MNEPRSAAHITNENCPARPRRWSSGTAPKRIPAPMDDQHGPLSNQRREPGSEMANERLAYSLHETARLLGVNYFSVYRLVQRGKLRVCRALRGKLLVQRTELMRMLERE